MASADESVLTKGEAEKLLECPVCLDVPFPPIYQCHNGHLICGDCYVPEIQLCPTCRNAMPKIPFRNLIVEQMVQNIITEKCPNWKSGCQIRVKVEEKENHQAVCNYSSCDYCNRLGLGKLLGCTQKIFKKDISDHMKKDHMLDSLVSDVHHIEIVQKVDDIEKLEPLKWLPVIFSVFNEHFFLVSGLSKGTDMDSSIVSWKCIMAAPKHVSRKFTTEFSLSNPDTKDGLNWKVPVISMDEMYDFVDNFSLSLATMRKFNTGSQNTFSWTIRVLIKNTQTNSSAIEGVIKVIKTISISDLEPSVKSIELQKLSGKESFAKKPHSTSENRTSSPSKGLQPIKRYENMKKLVHQYCSLGAYEEAVEYCKKTVQDLEKDIGRDHSCTTDALNELSHIYRYQKKYEEAEVILNEVLANRQKLFGETHLSVAPILNNLSIVYEKFDKYKEAEDFLQRALSIREKALGIHPDVGKQFSNLAVLYFNQRKYTKAEEYYKRALEIYGSKCKPDNAEVIKTKNRLAACYNKEGKFNEAEILSKDVLTMEHERENGTSNFMLMIRNLQKKNQLIWQLADEHEEKQQINKDWNLEFEMCFRSDSKPRLRVGNGKVGNFPISHWEKWEAN